MGDWDNAPPSAGHSELHLYKDYRQRKKYSKRYLDGETDKPNDYFDRAGGEIEMPDLADAFDERSDVCRGGVLGGLASDLGDGIYAPMYLGQPLNVVGGISQDLAPCVQFSCRKNRFDADDPLDFISAVFITPRDNFLEANPGAHEVQYTMDDIGRNEDLLVYLLGNQKMDYRMNMDAAKARKDDAMAKRVRNQALDQAFRYMNEMEIIREGRRPLHLPHGKLALRITPGQCGVINQERERKRGETVGDKSMDACMRYVSDHIDGYLDRKKVRNVDEIWFYRCGYGDCETHECELDTVRGRD